MLFAKLLERTSASYLPLQGHIRDDVVLIDDGSVLAMIELDGLPWMTVDPQILADRHNRLNGTLKQIASENVILHIYQCRARAPDSVYPDGWFRSAFAAGLDRDYRASLATHTLYRHRLFLAIQVRPERLAGEFVGEQAELRRRKPEETAPASRIQRLTDIVSLLMVDLRSYVPRRLGTRQAGGHLFTEIGEALVTALSGFWRPVPVTTGRMGDCLFSEHIVIDRDVIRFLAPGSEWYGAMFGMRHFPAWTWPGMFGALLQAPYLCTTVHTYRFVQTATAQDIMRRKRSRMLAAEDPAESQAVALLQAADGLGSADYAFGDYSFSHLAFAASPVALRDVASAAWSLLANSGMHVAREWPGLEAAFFSMVPGKARLRPRPGYVTTRNLAGMAPLHNDPSGRPTGYWGAPAAIFRTTSGEPFSYHFHVGDVGNTFVCGMTGSGKSTLVAFLIAQAERAGATIVCWDKDRGLKVLVSALGGSYLELRNPTGLAPLRRLSGDNTEDMGFLAGLVRGCIMADGGPQLTPEEDRRLQLGLAIIMAQDPSDRSLGALRSFLGVSEAGAGARLARWCAGGDLGWIIDNPLDAIDLDAPVIGFDQTMILDNPQARGPVMATLYHYVDKLIDGRRLLFVIDEFWKSLLDPTFRALVGDKLRTLRKRNSPMILATQSPRDALQSEIAHVIRDQCPSAFYFANARAGWDDYGEPGMGLSRTEFDLVRGLRSGSGDFLLRQGAHSVVASLPLAGMDDAIAVLSGRETNIRVFDRVTKGDITETLAEFHRQRREVVEA